jgi:hypothetical protein
MTREKFKEILNIVYKDKSSRSQIMNVKMRPSWSKLREFKKHGVPSDAFIDNINNWLKKEEEKQQNP